MFSKIFNKKVLLTLLFVFIGLMLVSIGSTAFADSTSAAASTSKQNAEGSSCFGGQSWILWVFIIVICGGMFVLSYFKKKKAVEENQQKMDMMAPGTKIKTIGLIDAEILEVYEDSLLIQSGNSTLKIDKRAVWQIIPEPQPEVEQVEESQEPFSEELGTQEPFSEELGNQDGDSEVLQETEQQEETLESEESVEVAEETQEKTEE